jgi:hypothetical protein
MLGPDGALPARAFEPPDVDPGPKPFSRLPWDLRVAPNCLPAGSAVPWWWRERVDARTFLRGIQPELVPPAARGGERGDGDGR